MMIFEILFKQTLTIMKFRNKIIAVIFTVIILQLPSAKMLAQMQYSEEKPVECYLGFTFSWSNYKNSEGIYVYYFRVFNHYTKAAKFDCYFTVGGKTLNRGPIGMVPANGGKYGDGMNEFESGEVPTCVIENVCFEGMKCGGEDRCYARCSTVDEPNEPVIPCGMKLKQDETEPKPVQKNEDGQKKETSVDYSGEYTKWEGETNKAMSLTIGETEAAIFVKHVSGAAPRIYKAIIPGVYKYDMAQGFMKIEFEGKDRFSLWDNQSLVGYFIRPGSAKETAKIKPDEEDIIINTGVWKRGSSQGKVKMRMVERAIMFQPISDFKRTEERRSKIATNEYRDSEYGVLTVKSPTRIGYKLNGIEFDDYEFIAGSEEESGVSAVNFNGRWKSDIDKNLTVTLTASSENEFLYNWVVSAIIKVKGKANFKRESGNIFIAKITGLKCYTAKITYISNDRLGIKVYKCSGALEKDGELYRVDD
jgi:hypothetical protein